MLKLLTTLLLASQFSFASEKSIALNKDNTAIIIEEEFENNKQVATIQVLNKITAKARYLNIAVNSEAIVGTIKIKINACWKSSPYDLSENKILLDIDEKKIGEENYENIFSNWMFSSSPGISSLEHAVYDVIAINCFDKPKE